MVRDEIERQNPGYIGGLEMLSGSNDTSLVLNTRMLHRNYALTPNFTHGVSSMKKGPSYGDNQEQVRDTMYSTGSFAGTIEVLGELNQTSFGRTNIGQTEITGMEAKQNHPMVTIKTAERNRTMAGRSEISSNLQSKLVKEETETTEETKSFTIEEPRTENLSPQK